MQNGSKVVSFSMATSEAWGAGAERKVKSVWHNVVIFNERAGDIAMRYLKKGSKVYITGQIDNRKYTDKAGVEKYITEIVIGKFKGELVLLEDARSSGGSRAGGGSEEPEDDDSIPF